MMANDSVSPARNIVRINPVLDFTHDTAFVAVKIPLTTGKSITDQVAVMTSNRELIIWNEDSQFGADILANCNCPSLIEPRWTSQSIHAFQTGADPPTSTAIYHGVRSYLQKYLGFRHPAEYDLVTLWIMGTYLKPLFKCYPILFFNAPYESGKSRCLEVVSQLSFNGKWFGEVTPAGFRRYGSEIKPTFCLDELKDVGLKNDSPMISILSSQSLGASSQSLAERLRHWPAYTRLSRQGLPRYRPLLRQYSASSISLNCVVSMTIKNLSRVCSNVHFLLYR